MPSAGQYCEKTIRRRRSGGSPAGRRTSIRAGCGLCLGRSLQKMGGNGINWIRSPLCGGIEKSGNEDRLSSDIASADLSNLPLPDHRHRFETCLRSSGGSAPAEAEPRSDQTLDAPMILLDNIIQRSGLPETRTAPRVRRLSSSPRPPLDRRGFLSTVSVRGLTVCGWPAPWGRTVSL